MRALLTAVLLAGFTAAARAASTFYIRGGGDGHGIGMSQYGAYGYALHGADYGRSWPTTTRAPRWPPPTPARPSGCCWPPARPRSAAPPRAGSPTRLSPGRHLHRQAGRGQADDHDAAGRPVGTFAAPLTVTAAHPAARWPSPGHGGYRGTLQFSPGGGGVQTVNAVGLDDYVRGVVAAEMPSSWAAAALEAQAVAARTYAITTTVGGSGYDLYSDTRSQMYGGVSAETPSTDAAVAATSGQIVTSTAGPRSPISSPPRAATPRASRTCGPARRPSRGCAESRTPTTTPAATPTTAGARR